MRWWLRTESIADFFRRVVALVVGFLVVDRLGERFASIDAESPYESVLVVEAIRDNPLPVALLVVGAASLVWFGSGRIWSPWSTLDHGAALRWFALPLIVLLIWRYALYDYHFVFDRWHGVDRLAVVILGVGALWRPVFLVPFVVQCRVVSAQFVVFLGFSSGANIDLMPLLVLLAIGVVYLRYVISGDRRTSGGVLLISSIVASFFFHPGVSKLRLGWLEGNDLSNFPPSSHVAGWVGSGDGGWSRRLDRWAEIGEMPVVLGVVLLELGAIVAVLHYRLLRWWLPGWMLFHTAIFLATGFWLLEQAVVEGALLLLLSRTSVRDWLAPNTTPARAATAALLVLGGSVFFGPPRLAWFDAPVAQAFAVEVEGDSGTVYRVALQEFDPIAGDVSFMHVSVEERSHAIGAYGAVFTSDIDAVEAIDTFEELDDFRMTRPVVTERRRDTSELVFTSFVDHVNEHGSPQSWWPSPMPRFWTSVPAPSYEFQEPIEALRVYRVDRLHARGITRETLVMQIGLDGSGKAVVEEMLRQDR